MHISTQSACECDGACLVPQKSSSGQCMANMSLVNSELRHEFRFSGLAARSGVTSKLVKSLYVLWVLSIACL